MLVMRVLKLLSIACGLALSNEIKNKENYVVPVIGDGSLVEG